ncbi:hypothetical protein L227DRAFT_417292 [Lentinus tigrinus ALCF2SS1-6]|uniref:Uncharacterized protein n=1 Tax=Lentinus tigrinus ALCF2SS1-6 TaxID=1328759 RepID=A0A5C2SP04_9APHY|nr:hypothetical protein L227DRAFT_417292 [Lentinus tigrinus ALCF2SS1-6]
MNMLASRALNVGLTLQSPSVLHGVRAARKGKTTSTRRHSAHEGSCDHDKLSDTKLLEAMCYTRGTGTVRPGARSDGGSQWMPVLSLSMSSLRFFPTSPARW